MDVMCRGAHLILFCVAKSFLSSSVLSGQNTLLYRRVMMYFSTWSMTRSTDSEEPADTEASVRAQEFTVHILTVMEWTVGCSGFTPTFKVTH